MPQNATASSFGLFVFYLAYAISLLVHSPMYPPTLMTKVSFAMSILRLCDCQFPESKSALVIADLQSAEYQVDLRQSVTLPDAGSVLMPEKLCNALPPVEELKKLLKMNKRKIY